jgi:hypothetical protein
LQILATDEQRKDPGPRETLVAEEGESPVSGSELGRRFLTLSFQRCDFPVEACDRFFPTILSGIVWKDCRMLRGGPLNLKTASAVDDPNTSVGSETEKPSFRSAA